MIDFDQISSFLEEKLVFFGRFFHVSVLRAEKDNGRGTDRESAKAKEPSMTSRLLRGGRSFATQTHTKRVSATCLVGKRDARAQHPQKKQQKKQLLPLIHPAQPTGTPPSSRFSPLVLGSSRASVSASSLRHIACGASVDSPPSLSVSARMKELKEQGKCALIPFIVAGDPDMETTALALQAVSETT